MVNSKKMSKSSIAVIVLSILLVLSLILGFTGAWFTDRTEGSSSDLQFGIVKLEQTTPSAMTIATRTNAGESDGKLMPGDKINVAGAVTNKGAEAWVSVVASLTFEADYSIEAPEGWSWDTEKKVLTKTATPVAVAKDGKVDLATTVTIPEALGNAAANTKVTLTCEVRAIQKANLTAEQAATELAKANLDKQTKDVA